MEKIETTKLKDTKQIEVFTKLLFKEINETNELLDNALVEEMLQDVDIATLVSKINRAVAKRELVVRTDKESLEGLREQIQARFNVAKFNRIFKHMLSARYYGFSLFEKVYDENYTLQTLVQIPQKYVVYDDKIGWYINVSNSREVIDRDRFLLCLHERDVANKKGKSIFKECQQAFIDKRMFSRQLRGLAQKYGETIVFFAYDAEESEEDVKAKVEQVKKMQGGNSVVAVPAMYGVSLKDSIYLLDIKDIDPSIYTNLHDWEKEKITQNLLGGTLTIDNGQGSGSYGLGDIHLKAFEEVAEDCCNFITDKLQELLYYDSIYFGYDYRDFYFKLEKVKNRDEEMEYLHKKADLEIKKQQAIALELDNKIKAKENNIEVEENVED